MIRSLIISLFILSFASAVSGCSDTWRGVKKDTGDNMQTTGSAIEKTGEKVKE
jgi:predicted small secreted protein